jgi:hypothetical protein
MSGDVIHEYLAELVTRLPGSTRDRAAILAEMEDGLADAVADHTARGAEPAEAARMAVAEFGSPALIAAEFTPVLATSQAHRYGLAFIATGPMVGGVWLTAAVLSPLRQVSAMQIAAVVLALALVLAVPCAVFAVAATGSLLTARPRSALTAVTITACGAVIGDLALLVGLFAAMLTMPAAVAVLPASLAALASLTRLAFAGRGASRLHATRAALG